jgi:hypothetical protein
MQVVKRIENEGLYQLMQDIVRIGNQAVMQALEENKRFGDLNKAGILNNNVRRITTLCKSHQVKALYAFGSALTDRFTAESDIDLLVSFEEMDPLNYADNYFDLKFKLEELMKREIDLLEEQAIRNTHLRKKIDATKKLVYERGS